MIVVTGTSRGLGKAIGQAYIQSGEQVVAIGRNHSVESENYHPIWCDLSSPVEISNLELPDFSQCKEITFIHNAGILGEIGYIDQVAEGNFESVFQVNVFAGIQLVRKILKEVHKETPLTIVFISSGAGRSPIASWSAYCASKAAVDMFCQTLSAEQNELGRANFHCFSVAPGVVDTEMQEVIRNTSPDRFRMVQKFQQYHLNQELISPELAAKKLRILLSDKSNANILCSLRDVKS